MTNSFLCRSLSSSSFPNIFHSNIVASCQPNSLFFRINTSSGDRHKNAQTRSALMPPSQNAPNCKAQERNYNHERESEREKKAVSGEQNLPMI
jgi:hypothetical protein